MLRREPAKWESEGYLGAFSGSQFKDAPQTLSPGPNAAQAVACVTLIEIKTLAVIS